MYSKIFLKETLRPFFRRDYLRLLLQLLPRKARDALMPVNERASMIAVGSQHDIGNGVLLLRIDIVFAAL